MRRFGAVAVLLVVSTGCTNPVDTSPVDSDPGRAPATTGAPGEGQGSGGQGGGGQGSGSGGGGSAAGGPTAGGDAGGGSAGGGVIGSPIRMPGFVQRGIPINELYDDFIDELEKACGTGSLCVEVVVESADGKGPDSTCGFDETRPAGGSLVERGSTVVFVTMPRCEGLEEGGTTEGTDGSTQPPSTGPPSTEAPPTEPPPTGPVDQPVPSAGSPGS